MSQALTPADQPGPPPPPATLRAKLDQRRASGRRFTLGEVVTAIVPLCTDLAQRHANGEPVMVHPSAIALANGGGDGGVQGARLIVSAARTRPSDPRDLAAIAPEVLAGAPPSARGSVFGIGAVAYEMLTSIPVGPGMHAPTHVVPGLPHLLDTILAKALTTNAAERPDDLAALAHAFHHLAPAAAREPPDADDSFEVEIDLPSSMLPSAEVHALPPDIPRATPVGVRNDDPFAAMAAAMPAAMPASARQGDPDAPSARAAEATVRGAQERTIEELAALKARLEADPEPRWVVVKDKMDHGPFAALELLQQLSVDTFTEEAVLVDLHSGERCTIKEHPEFSRFAHHAALKRSEVREAKAVKVAEKREMAAGAAKGTLGVIAVVAALLVVGIVVWRIKGKADEEARRRADEALNIAGEGSVAARAREVKKRAPSGGGGPGYGGRSFEEAKSTVVSDFEAETLTTKDCAAPVGGDIAGGCGLSGSARAAYMVKNGRAVGVTVTTTPSQPGVNACMAGRIGGLSWRNVPGATPCIRTFKAD